VAAQYHLLRAFTFRGDQGADWTALVDVESWPAWWSWLKRTEVRRPTTAAGDAFGTGLAKMAGAEVASTRSTTIGPVGPAAR
jgi:hypothetical protein